MAHSFLTYNSHLAQMPTDQRELEYHRLLVQTEFLNTNGILQANALRPYNPCYPPPDWPPFRPAPAMKSTVLHPHPGYSDSWAATVSEPYHFDISYLAQNMVPGSSYHPQTYFAPISRPAPVFPSQSIMDHPRPSVTECEQENSMEWHHAEPLTSSWLSQQQLHQRTKLDGFDETFQSFAGSSQSPITVSSRHSPSRSYNGSPIGTGSTSISMGAEDISPHTSPEDTCEEDHSTEPPYSQLIYQALVEQKEEGYKLPLQGIYAWFEKNTNKGKDHSQKGWQNSIRHNLSMNAGFEAVKGEAPNGKKTVNYWRLTDESIRNGGVQSTTRYRKPVNNKRPASTEPPVPHSQGAGQKSGKITRNATRARQNSHDQQQTQQQQLLDGYVPATIHHVHPPPQSPLRSEDLFLPPVMQPYQIPIAGPPMSQSSTWLESYPLSSVTGCTSLPPGSEPAFCESVDQGPVYSPEREHPGWFR